MTLCLLLRRVIFTGLLVSACILGAILPALSEATQSPAFQKLRFNEDYRFYADQEPGNFLEDIKYIPFGGNGNFLSLGGEIRERYEYTENPSFGADPQDKNGVWLQRLVLQADVHLGEHFRIFSQLSSSLSAGRNGGPSPVDEDRLDLQNAFIDIATAPAVEDMVRLRVGRQEISLGSGRLVDVREGPDVRRNFDGLRFDIGEKKGWTSSIIALRPVVPSEGVFDDRTNRDQALWGAYATIPSDFPTSHSDMDIYYLGYQSENAVFVQGTADEVRHSLGMRLFGDKVGWDWNWEAVGQFGTFGDSDIVAWTLAMDTGYQIADFTWKPRFGASINIASGDHSASDGQLNTFNPLFPRGNYFSNAAVLGPRNFFNLNPSIEVHPSSILTMGANVNFFWRLETNDGVYTPSGSILRAPNGSDKRYVATAISANISAQLTERFSLEAVYTHMQPGTFIKATGADDPINFYEFTAKFRF
ncbi:alginate export family protein [Sneathiella sp.]|uniref:alginate export family protein n=1 Tax=Sneathiella sp. TaxID=1964365 RepID=UPI003564BF6F